MEIGDFLVLFNDLISNKESIDGQKATNSYGSNARFGQPKNVYKKDTVNLSRTTDLSKKRETDLANSSFMANRLCHLCGALNHFTDRCLRSNNLSPREVMDKVRKTDLCLKCLRSKHRADNCVSNVVCNECGFKGHHMLVCKSRNNVNNANRYPLNPDAPPFNEGDQYEA